MKKTIILFGLIILLLPIVVHSQEFGLNFGLSNNILFPGQKNVNSNAGNIGTSAGIKFDGLFSTEGFLGYNIEAIFGQFSYTYFDAENNFREFRFNEKNLYVPLNLTARMKFSDSGHWISYGFGPYVSFLIGQKGFSAASSSPFNNDSAGFADRVNLGFSGEAKYFRMLNPGMGITLGVNFRSDLSNPLSEKNNILVAPGNSIGLVIGVFRKF